MPIYFAYGSNMNPEQIKARVGNVPTPLPAVLKGYKLVFNIWADKRHCWGANVIKTENPADTVEGILYQLTPSQIAQLDPYEDYNPERPYNPKGYDRRNVTVVVDGRSQTAETYLTDNNEVTDECIPSLAYIENFLQGKKYYSNTWYNFLLDLPLSDGSSARMHLETPSLHAAPRQINNANVIDALPSSQTEETSSSSNSSLSRMF